MADYIVENNRPLTLVDVENLYEYGFDKSLTSEDIGIVDYENDDHLKESDYIISDIKIGDSHYYLIHGFPGDNPQGAIFNSHKTYLVGECMPEDVDESAEPIVWYNKITKGCCRYKETFWYANRRD